MSEAAEDQGWGRESVDHLREQLTELVHPTTHPGIELPDDHDREVGLTGIAQARETMRRARMAQLVGPDEDAG